MQNLLNLHLVNYPFKGLPEIKETEQELNLIKEEFLRNPKLFKTEIDPEAFRSLINGLFQAEGRIGVYFPYKESLKFNYLLS